MEKRYRSYTLDAVQERHPGKDNTDELEALRGQIEYLRQETPRHPALVQSTIPESSHIKNLPRARAGLSATGTPEKLKRNSAPGSDIRKRYDFPHR